MPRLFNAALPSLVLLGVAAAQSTSAGATDITTHDPSDGLPLAASRRIAFTTSEGTWISLDVSPDGRTLVFELLGDLYTLPLAGGTARRLTSGPAFDTQPRWSPDGKRIVFISDRDGSENVWICDAQGAGFRQVSRLTTGVFASPVWTPDGKSVVTSYQPDNYGFSTYQLWQYHIDGGAGMNLTKTDHGRNAVGDGFSAGIDALGAAFGADPRYIWFARHRGGNGFDLASFPQWQLATFDRENGQVAVQSDNYGGGMRPVLSHDGKWLVFATRRDGETGLRLRDLANGAERWLVWPVQRDDQESRFTRDLMPGSAFLPDSSALVTSYHGKLWRVPVPDGQVTEIAFRAEVEQSVGPLAKFESRIDTGAVLVRQVRYPALSPDGTRVVFGALGRLYIMDWPHGDPRQLTPDGIAAHVPAWSPDGRWIAYVSWDDIAGGAVWRLRADGRGRPERLTPQSGFFDAPAWSPDGQRIAALRMPTDLRRRARSKPGASSSIPAGVELVWLPAAGGTPRHVTYVNWGTNMVTSAVHGRPHFTHDASRIYLYDRQDGLVSMRLDGSDRRVHLKVTGYKSPQDKAEPASAEEIVVSPDGERAAVEIGHQVWLTPLLQTGGQVPTLDVTKPAAAAFPLKRLTRVGGEFAGWSGDGRFVQWSLGRSLFRYDSRGAGEGERSDVRIGVSRDVPRGTLVLRGARLVTMHGDEVIERGDIVIRDNRIVSIGPSGGGAIPTGAQVLDVTGKTIIPGLVDIHAHMAPAWGVQQTQVWRYLAMLAYGVTTTRDPQTMTTDVLTYADRVETGELAGPRIFSTGPGIFTEENFQSLDEAREALRRYSEFYDTRTIKQYLVGNRRQRQWLIMAAKELGLTPTIEGGNDFKMNLTVILDGYAGHEHGYPVVPLFRDVVELAAQSGITYTPTLLVNYGGPLAEHYFYERIDIHDDPKVRRFFPHEDIDARVERRPWFRENQYVFERIAQGAAAIVRAGGRVGLGSHGNLPGLGAHWELQLLTRGGLTPQQALRAGTLHGAEAIGLAQDLGSLEAGKLADLVVLDQNPLEDIRNTQTIRYVLKNGRLYEGDTLTEIYPRRREQGPFWWATDALQPETK